ncbi:MAG: hypothetical protein NPMRTH4_360004 [Nitrosopumilales archaeon]|nr:MAG: hypothetical protein NPMRTH4_360004 [Nitrosopumilales archaeon]
MIEITADNIIGINEQILKEYLEIHPRNHERIGVRKHELERILIEAETINSIIDKAAFILAAIPWAQPFSGGNKRTAYATAKILLENNGYNFEIQSKKDEEFLRKLLFEIQEERARLNEATLAKITLYLHNRTSEI